MRNLTLVAFWAATTVLHVSAIAPDLSPKPPNTPTKNEEYISRFKDLAMFEQFTTNIPASIKLGQALLESEAGESELAMNANNHFGLKCKTCSESEAYMKTDDEYNRKGELIYSKFSRFDSPEASFAAHSSRLMDNIRYRQLFSYDRTDYRAWAYGLKACGYATDKYYAEKLINVIERHGLQRFDKPSLLSLSEFTQNPPPQYEEENLSVNIPYDSDPYVAKPQSPYYSEQDAQNGVSKREKQNKKKEVDAKKITNHYRTESEFTTQEGSQMHFTLYEVTLEDGNQVIAKSIPKKQVKSLSKPTQRKKIVRVKK
jgi:Mannosyl-glycoprotein endo-beta-N-acetylglucosaminidase